MIEARPVAIWGSISLQHKKQLLHHCRLCGFDDSDEGPTDEAYLGIMRDALHDVNESVTLDIVRTFLDMAFRMKVIMRNRVLSHFKPLFNE
jgi:hypothetical protein